MRYVSRGNLIIKKETSPTDYEMGKLWSTYKKKNEMEIRKKLIDLFETTKKQVGERYVQDIGESLDKLAPANEPKKNREARFFWDTVNEWDPKIEKKMKNHLDKMEKIFE